ncbi:hemerythrin [Synergistales bacterium]|nr:hemerythrin [Synergistales bacterium]
MLWNSSLETGIKLVDEQHKQLFDKADELLVASSGDTIKKVLDFLASYIVKHFTDEQSLHQSVSYPKATAHRGYHNEYVKTFKKFQEQYEKEGPTLSNKMAANKIVVGWLKDHIMVHDKEFTKYYKEKTAQK